MSTDIKKRTALVAEVHANAEWGFRVFRDWVQEAEALCSGAFWRRFCSMERQQSTDQAWTVREIYGQSDECDL